MAVDGEVRLQAILPVGEKEPSEEKRERLTEGQVKDRAEQEFMRRLHAFLVGEPYFVNLLVGSRQERRRAGKLLGKALTTIPSPKLEDRQELPNRDTRRQIVKIAKRATRENADAKAEKVGESGPTDGAMVLGTTPASPGA